MNEKQKRILRLEYKTNCYVLVSFKRRDPAETHGAFYVKSFLSFFYVDESAGVAVEWEPEHGPIQIFRRAEKDDKGAIEHYAFDYVFDEPLSWRQLAVEYEGLPQHAHAGSWNAIFRVLEKWSKHR